MSEEKSKFVRVKELAEMLACSESLAYQKMRKLNKELQSKGYITISGRVPRKYLEERLYL